MQIITPVIAGNYYHIYNKGNNSENIFFDNDNYLHFLRLYSKYINPIADTFAWCLLKNHFHIILRIKEYNEIIEDNFQYSTVEKPKAIEASKQFSHFFNAYTQYINKKHNRTGRLFQSRFKRKHIDSESYLKNLIFYVHNNPVHHGFCKDISNYRWSSYGSIISNKKTNLKRLEVINLFGNISDFIEYHENNYSDLIIENDF
ncbi:transposase [Flavobacterium sp.]|jgi:REP element-mobilizing transposase RayT|uniref:transposase n=1 Tax=Flavobacterium sp. TaxID=239 RepID=UPI0037C07316